MTIEPIDWTARLVEALNASQDRMRRHAHLRAEVAAARAVVKTRRHAAKLENQRPPLNPTPVIQHPAGERRERSVPLPELGETLAAGRARSGLTLAALAELVGVRASWLSRLEKGGMCPSRTVAYRLIIALQLTGQDAGVVAASAAVPVNRP